MDNAMARLWLFALVLLLGGFVQVAAAENPPVWVMNIGGTGSDAGQYIMPIGIDYRPASSLVLGGSRLYVADKSNNRIATLGPWGETPGALSVTLSGPQGVAVSPAYAYIADTSNHRIVKRYLGFLFGTNTEWGSLGSGNTNFNWPTSIALDPAEKYLYVTDRFNNRVVKYTTSGTFVRTIGTAGTGGDPPGTGKLYSPCGIAVDPTNTYIYVTDGTNYLQRFTVDGAPAGYSGGTGSVPGKFDDPAGVTCDAAGNIYVADYGNQRVQKFDSSNNLLCTFGTPGNPYGVVVDPDGYIYVTEGLTNMIQKFARALQAVPPGSALPTDTNGDGKYDDVNGNGRRDFADVVLYFNQMTWIAANEPMAPFAPLDYTSNGRIDFADVVWLFTHL